MVSVVRSNAMFYLKFLFFTIAYSNISDQMIQANLKEYYLSNSYTTPDNVDINRHPITVG